MWKGMLALVMSGKWTKYDPFRKNFPTPRWRMLFIGDLLIRPFFATGLQDFFCSSFYTPHVLPGSVMLSNSLLLWKTIRDVVIFLAFLQQGARNRNKINSVNCKEKAWKNASVTTPDPSSHTILPSGADLDMASHLQSSLITLAQSSYTGE